PVFMRTVLDRLRLDMSPAPGRGRSTLSPEVIIGAATIMMMSRTSMTSTIGVTLISLMTPVFLRRRPRRPPPPPPPDAAPMPMSAAPRFELAGQDGGEFVGKAFQPADHLAGIGGELVIGDNRRNGSDETDCGGEQRFGDRAGHDGKIGIGRGRDIGEGVHDAPDRAEQADKGPGRTDSEIGRAHV